MGDDLDPEAYRRSMAINLDGVVYGITAARRAIKASGGGTIVATASMAGIVVAPFDPIYAANKHTVVGLVRSLGESYGSEGIRIHALCPWFAHTNIIKGSEQTLIDMGFPSSTCPTSSSPSSASSIPTPPGRRGTSWPVATASRSSSARSRAPARLTGQWRTYEKGEITPA